VNLGNLLLYSAFSIGSLIILLLLINLIKNIQVERYVQWLVRAFFMILLADMSLLTYYFIVSDISVNYVWTFTSKYLPLLYKLSGVLAGQQGTLLFWAFLISISALWINERKEYSDFIKKVQIIVLLLGLFFIALTIKESPFITIYDLYPDLPRDFLPEDGAGLNPLLIDPWMAVHPPVIFIAYATMTIPFAVAVVYLIKSIKEDTLKVYSEWSHIVTFWCRISWLFLTWGIAVGGFWAYKVLGWGGYWAWDPVETSSLIPWILLTGALHALSENRKKKESYNILAPVLVALSFSLVVYATLVTRSGFFESVHAFSTGQTGFYLLILVVVSILVSLILGSIKYVKRVDRHVEDIDNGEITLVNRTNIFYLAILLFVILTFISFWGITFPALTKLAMGKKIGMGISFFNIWSYPFIILLMLFGGLGLNYKHSEKKKQLRVFGLFILITLIAAVIKPSESWKIVEYSAIINPEKPFLYRLIGGASPLSIIPPSIYLTWGASERLLRRFKSKSMELKIKEVGIFIIHVGVVLIIAGSVVSTLFDKEFSTRVTIGNSELVRIEGTPYAVKLLGFDTEVVYIEDSASNDIPGDSLDEFYTKIGEEDVYLVHGKVEETVQTEHNTYMKLVDNGRELWVATNRVDIPKGALVVLSGNVMFDFASPTLNRVFDIILFAPHVEVYSMEPERYSTTELVKVAVYNGHNKIGEGTAKSITYKNGNVNKVMIDRSLTKDVYVIYTGKNGQEIPLTIKIKPYVSWTWVGVVLFSVGILFILFFDPVVKERRYQAE